MTLLKHVASVRVSNVDKKSYPDEAPVRLCNYTDVYYGHEIRADRGDFMAATASAEQVRSFRVIEGDTVLTKDSETADDIGISAYIAATAPDFVCGYHLAISRPDPARVDPKFLFWSTRSSAFRNQLSVAATGVTRYGLRSDALANTELSLPPLEEQRRIADFLDDQIARLDRAIAATGRQRELLSRAQQALVEASVMGLNEPGIRSHTPVSWIGSVPADWSVQPIGRRFEVQLGKMLAPERVKGLYERPYLRNTNVQWDRVDTEDLKTMNFPPAERERYSVRRGDLLVCEGGDIGRAAIWDGSIGEIYYQKALHRVRPRGATGVRWLLYVLRAATRLGVFSAEGGLSTIAHLTAEQLRAHRIPIPTKEAEKRLVTALDERAAHSRDAEALIGKRLLLLQERKQALITAAVTGQFDVTTARAVAS